ncbi:MAG TPA: DUF5709 domain-containing protein [Jatrophihabitantaceae bacterium]|jgi:hypothetical protein|nr:DUF5709 domain-containing protein [Jatrophihabitantaceae bacterium]
MNSESDDLYVGGFGGNDQVDPSESLTGDNTEDPLDAGYSPPERESHSWRGDTADEAREGETLDQHLAEENPEVWDDDSDDDTEPEERTGRLVDTDYGALEDTEKDEVAVDVGRAGSASSAEEAAMHVIADDDSGEA